MSAAVEALLPALCPHCGDPLAGTARGLCDGCWTRLAPRAGAACESCGAPIAAPESLCLRCVREAPPQTATVIWGEHEDVLRTAILAVKHGRRDDLVAPLGRRLAAAVAATGWAGEVELVTWVPSHALRRLRRPWSAAELLARELARVLGLAVRPVLSRRGLARQTGRSRARRLQLARDVFRCRRLRGRPVVLLVDDVVTTGTTLERSAAALKRAGARAVFAAALARSPDPRSIS